MAISIFWRLICGYSVILILSVGVSSYSIVQLGRLSNSAHTALNTDHQMIAYEETLTDVFLSEVRYAGKFIITHAPMHRDQLRQFKGDFNRYLDELKALAESPDIKDRLARVEEFHLRYHVLFDQEVTYIKARQPYAETRYREEKEKVLESVLRELEVVKGQLQQHLQKKLESIETAARRTRTMAMVTTLILVALGFAVSFFISKSIVGPLSELKRVARTTENDSDTRSELFRIPEIQELADAFSKARHDLADTAARNASFTRSMRDQFAGPLVSIHKRLRHLQAELAESIKAEQRHHINILADEITRLVQRLPQLSEPVSAAETVARPQAVNTIQRPPAVKISTEERQHRHSSFVAEWLRKLNSVITLGRSLGAGSWNTIRESIATLAYGKVKKP